MPGIEAELCSHAQKFTHAYSDSYLWLRTIFESRSSCSLRHSSNFSPCHLFTAGYLSSQFYLQNNNKKIKKSPSGEFPALWVSPEPVGNHSSEMWVDSVFSRENVNTPNHRDVSSQWGEMTDVTWGDTHTHTQGSQWLSKWTADINHRIKILLASFPSACDQTFLLIYPVMIFWWFYNSIQISFIANFFQVFKKVRWMTQDVCKNQAGTLIAPWWLAVVERHLPATLLLLAAIFCKKKTKNICLLLGATGWISEARHVSHMV